jgi:hypothetical protein
MTKMSQHPPRPARLLMLTSDIVRIGYHRVLAKYHRRRYRRHRDYLRDIREPNRYRPRRTAEEVRREVRQRQL